MISHIQRGGVCVAVGMVKSRPIKETLLLPIKRDALVGPLQP